MAKNKKKSATTKSGGEKVMAFCMKTRQKEEMLKPNIEKTKTGQYMAKGKTKDGHTVTLILSETKALDLIKSKTATKGY